MRADVKTLQARGTTFPGSKDPSDYFLTVQTHCRVKVDGETDDHTVDVMMRRLDLPSNLEFFPTSRWKLPQIRHSRVVGSDRGYSKGHTPQISSEMAEAIEAHLPRKRYQARIHYRIVFNEVGKTIHDLHRLTDVYQCLWDATIGVFSDRFHNHMLKSYY
jgi:hypothetical protein